MHKYSLNIFRKNINILLKLTLAVCCLGVVTPSLQLALGGKGLNFISDVAEKIKINLYTSNIKKIWCTNGVLTFSMFFMECSI